MAHGQFDVVTGAFGYTGRHIARELLARGRRVRTLTDHPVLDDPLAANIEAKSFNFDRPDALATSLRGADTLYNTYWVRFCHKAATFTRAVENTRTLVRAAELAGVRRVVHISITNPAIDSPLPYFSGKAELEEFIGRSRLSWAIVRPTVIFGGADILLNNIAWCLRRVPVFLLPGDGEYRVQPVHVEDVARLAVQVGAGTDNVVVDAVGPEVLSFRRVVELIARHVGSQARIVRAPAALALAAAQVIGQMVGDVMLTWDEIAGLRNNLLISHCPATCPTRLSAWLVEHADTIGQTYASELGRHFRRQAG